MKASRLRFGLGLVGVVGIAAATMSGSSIAHAAGSLALTPATVNGTTCHNLNPDLEIHTNAMTAVADGPGRSYTQISSVSVAGGPTIDGIAEAAVTVNLCGAVPSFPNTGNGDTGVQFYVCMSPGSNEPIESGRFGAVAGNAAITGDPIFDGPYPKSQGHRLCVWASDDAGAGIDYGVAYYDPIAQFTFLDPANLFDGTPANPTVTKTTLATGASSFTMYFPYIWRQTVNGGLPTQVVESSQVMAAGDTTTDWVAESEASITIGLPTAVCAPATSICVQGILGELVPVDFAPGYEVCASAATGCAQFGPLGFDLGVENDFPVSSIQTCVNPVNPPGNNPINPDLTCDVATPATGGPAGTQGLPYATVFEYGRILPGAVVPFEGFNYQPFGSFVDDGQNFAA